MIPRLLQRIRSLRWLFLISILLSSTLVFLGATGISTLLYERLLAEQALLLSQQIAPPVLLPATEISTSVRLTYILTFILLSCIILALATWLAHWLTSRLQQALDRFQYKISQIQSSQDLALFDAQPETLSFKELEPAFASINQLTRQLDSILVDKKLLEKAINQVEQENEMAANILYGHLLVKSADPLASVQYKIRSSTNFSGDLVLVKKSPSGQVFILLADATGHGLAATITIMPVMSVFDSMVSKGHQLPAIVSEMNKRLLQDLPDDRFVAATLIEINLPRSEMSVWNGAMPPSFYLDAQGKIVHSFCSRNMALGILDAEVFNSSPERYSLPQSGYLLSYSDGLIEQPNQQEQLFGQQRLRDLLACTAGEHWIEAIFDEVAAHAQALELLDDVSVCQIDFAQLSREVPQLLRKSQLHSLHHDKEQPLSSPFEWKLRLQGEQLSRQTLPALCHDLLHNLGMGKELASRAYSCLLYFSQVVLDQLLLKLDPKLALVDYYQQKSAALKQLSAADFIELQIEGQLIPEVQLMIRIQASQGGRVSSLTPPLPLQPNDLISPTDQGVLIQLSAGTRIQTDEKA